MTPDVGMSPVGKTLKFPRKDNLYKKKESLPYDEVQSNVWQTRPRQRKTDHSREWLAHFYVGIAVAIVAFMMEVVEDGAKNVIIEPMQELI